MLKFRIPYSAVVTTIVSLAFSGPYAFVLGCVAGIIVETVTGAILYRSLQSKEEFFYDSFIGHLLSQFTAIGDVSFTDILHLVCARITSYIIAGLIFLPPNPMDLWFLLIPIILYLSTILHIVPRNIKRA
jgi:cobalamin biosynthesis protein CobD/CbiB